MSEKKTNVMISFIFEWFKKNNATAPDSHYIFLLLNK